MSHAAARAAERHGLTLAGADFQAMVLAITSAKLRLPSTALLQRTERCGTEIWFVDTPGGRVRVAYSPATAWVMTVLPARDKGGKLTRPIKKREWGRVRRERMREEEWA